MIKSIKSTTLKYNLDLTARLSWINWENLGVNPNRRNISSLTSYSRNTNVPIGPNEMGSSHCSQYQFNAERLRN